MKRFALYVFAMINFLALASPTTAIEHLMRPIYGEPTLQTLKVRSGYDTVSAFTGFISATNVTAFTAVLWARVVSRHHDYNDGGVFVQNDYTIETARSTTEGGPALNDLLHGECLEYHVPLSPFGTWQSRCLPDAYDCPDNIAAQWGYGCYCINVTTDTPFTLTVGGAELYVPVTNSMIRNILAVSSDRTITIAAESTYARIKLGIAINPLVQFVSAGKSSGMEGSSTRFDPQYGGLSQNEWRMIAVRGRVDGLAQTDTYNATSHFDLIDDATTEIAHPRATFARDARVRMLLGIITGGLTDDLQIKYYGGKLLNGWLTDGEIERIRDIDAAELRRRGELP